MEVINGFIISMIPPITLSRMTNWTSLSINIKLWPWFVVGLFLPFMGVVINLCLPVRGKKVQRPLPKQPVSSEEIFDPVLELKEPRKSTGGEIQFLARA